MIEPYNAVGLIPNFWGIRRRADIEKNLQHLESMTKAAFWLSSLDIPVRLIAIAEGALQGFNDEVLEVLRDVGAAADAPEVRDQSDRVIGLDHGALLAWGRGRGWQNSPPPAMAVTSKRRSWG